MNTGAPGNEKCYTILHVDHDLTELARLRVTLGRFPHLRCLSSPCALIGLEIARFRHPDLILLDVDSPAVDLAGMLAELGRDPRTQDIPVIAVSADHVGPLAAMLHAADDDGHHPYETPGHPPAGGLCGILRKPLSDTKLLRILGSACRPHALRQGQAEA